MKTIFKTKPTANFAIIPNATLRDSRLSFKARGVLAMILTHVGEWQVSKGWLAKNGTEGREAIKKALDELKALGYAKYEQTKGNDGKWTGHCWTFYDLPQELPLYGNTAGGKPADGKPDDGKPSPSEDHSQNTIPIKPEPQNTLRVCEGIYALYPRKVARPKALAAIAKQLKTYPQETLIIATRKMGEVWAGANRTQLTYCPHPATWFNGERFNDDPSTWRSGQENAAPDPHVAANGKRFSYMPGHALYGSEGV